MGFFGNIGRLFQPGASSTAPVDPTAAGAAPGAIDPRRRLFGDGSFGGVMDGVGKILTYGPFAGMVQGSINRRLDARAADAHRYRTMMGRNAGRPGAIGPQAGQPGFGANANAPTMPAPSSFPQAGSVPQDAIDQLRRNPALALHFDALYGPGAAARILN